MAIPTSDSDQGICDIRFQNYALPDCASVREYCGIRHEDCRVIWKVFCSLLPDNVKTRVGSKHQWRTSTDKLFFGLGLPTNAYRFCLFYNSEASLFGNTCGQTHGRAETKQCTFSEGEIQNCSNRRPLLSTCRCSLAAVSSSLPCTSQH